MTSLADLRTRGHSLRNYDPDEFYELYAEAVESEDYEKIRTLRGVLKFIESERFYPMLAATHKMFGALDPDERRSWADGNPELMEWTGVYGLVEDLTGFPEYTSADR